jgi:twitching motility protein PilT
LKLIDLLKTSLEKKASDLILKVDSSPIVRINGVLVKTDIPPLTMEDIMGYIVQIMSKEKMERFTKEHEINFPFSIKNLCRLRISCFTQRKKPSIVVRFIPEKIPVPEEIGIPPITTTLVSRQRGLILITGPSGCGKSTTLASMVEWKNRTEECHIMTVEDPIEFVFTDKKAMINQREILRDTKTFSNALKYVLRQDPDVIVIGEIRDYETTYQALIAAETGHLVLSTMHTIDAPQSIERIIGMFPAHQQRQSQIHLSNNLITVISQILAKKKDGSGRVPVTEIMITNPSIRNLIRQGKTFQIPSIIQTSQKNGMSSFDSSLNQLVEKNIISKEEAHSLSRKTEDFGESTPTSPKPQ